MIKFEKISSEIEDCDLQISRIDAQLQSLHTGTGRIRVEFERCSGAYVDRADYSKLLEDSRIKFCVRREGLIEAREVLSKVADGLLKDF